MDPTILCLALTLATETFAPMPAKNLALACEQAPILIAAAEEIDVEPSILAGLIYIESRWTPDAVSRAGACGLTQVLPRYVKETCTDLKDPTTSIQVGSQSLRKWSTKRVRRDGKLVRVPRKGGIREALACYNAGNACLGSSRGTAYANAVTRYAQRLESKISQVKKARKATDNFAVDDVDETHGLPMWSGILEVYWPVMAEKPYAYLPIFEMDDRSL